MTTTASPKPQSLSYVGASTTKTHDGTRVVATRLERTYRVEVLTGGGFGIGGRTLEEHEALNRSFATEAEALEHQELILELLPVEAAQREQKLRERAEAAVARKLARLERVSPVIPSQRLTEPSPVVEQYSAPTGPALDIADLRRKGWTVAKIAANLGVHRSSVYRWARGTVLPRPVYREALGQLVAPRPAVSLVGLIDECGCQGKGWIGTGQTYGSDGKLRANYGPCGSCNADGSRPNAAIAA